VAPGPSAVVAALVISGLPTDRFVFEGFLPRSGKARTERLAALAREPRTIVLFESPNRVARTLQDLLGAGGDRRVAVVRELTKMHQEVIRGSLKEVAETLATRELKGEVVIVVEGARTAGANFADAVGIAREQVRAGARKRDAAREAAASTGVPARRIYESLVTGIGSDPTERPAVRTTDRPQGAEAGSNRSSAGRRADSSE